MGKWKYFVQLTEQLVPYQDFICGHGVKPSTDVNCSAAAVTLCIKALHKKLWKSLKTYITPCHNQFLDFNLLTSFDRVWIQHIKGLFAPPTCSREIFMAEYLKVLWSLGKCMDSVVGFFTRIWVLNSFQQSVPISHCCQQQLVVKDTFCISY